MQSRRLESNAIFVYLEVPEEELIVSDEVALVAVGDNIFRLESFLLSEEVNWGDSIEVSRQSDKLFKLIRIVQKTDWSIYNNYVVGEDFLERPFGQYVVETIVEYGGIWELKCGGTFDVALPPTCDKTLDELWEACSDNLIQYKANGLESRCRKYESLDLNYEPVQTASNKGILNKIKNFFINTN